MILDRRDCPFCGLMDAILRNGLACALYDTSPVTPGHALIVPARQIADCFDTTGEVRESLLNLAHEMRALLEREHHPDGCNPGIHVGEAAGQTIFHVHPHLIPRCRGDAANPRGSVRGVVPARQRY